MMMWHGNWSGADWVLMSVGMLVFWAAVIGGILWLVRATSARSHSQPSGVSLDERDEPGGLTARDILDHRYARGELSDEDYRTRRDTLTIRLTSIGRRRKWGALPVGAAVVVLAATSTTAIAATSGAFADHQGGNASNRSCALPALPGSLVPVTLVDMRDMMGRTMTGGAMMNSGGTRMGQRDWPRFRPGMMRVTLALTSVSHGTVSLRVHNTGYLTHEVVVLRLAPGQAAGTRAPGTDGKVAEDRSMGEASASCAAGTGDGITAGSTGWVTLILPAGRYEIVCNLPGHYAAGMHTEFDVT